MPLYDVLRPNLFRDNSRASPHDPTTPTLNHPPQQTFRRITGYHNATEDESTAPPFEPPPYALSKFASQRSSGKTESLPGYSCSVAKEGVLEWKLERSGPFDEVDQPAWEMVYVRLQGTLLSINTVKNPGLFSSSKRDSPTAGRVIREYTMQHGEIGVASDHKKVELVPRSHLAQILPASALTRLQETEPHMFETIHYYVARLRLEGDQFLLRFKSSEDRSLWINHLCASVDIAPPLEVRSEPKYHTLPRRRRRQNHRTADRDNVNPNSRHLIEQQERIARQHFPNLVRSATSPNFPTSPLPNTDDAPVPAEGPDHDPEADDLDRDFMLTADPDSSSRRPRDRQDEELAGRLDEFLGFGGSGQARRGSGRSRDRRRRHSLGEVDAELAAETMEESGAELNETSEENEKWAPNIEIDPVREARYRRRCMPMLVYNSRHAQDIIVRNGRVLRVDFENRVLKPFPLTPPSYAECNVPPSPEALDPSEEIARRANLQGGRTLPPHLNSRSLWRPRSSQDAGPRTAPAERTFELAAETQAPHSARNESSLSSAEATGDTSFDEDRTNESGMVNKISWSGRLKRWTSRLDVARDGRRPVEDRDLEQDEEDEEDERPRRVYSPAETPLYNATGIHDKTLRRLGF